MRILNVNLPEKKYPIFIKRGILNELGKEIRKIYNNKKIAIIVDLNLKELYGQKLINTLKDEDFEIKLIEVKPGEKSKSLEKAQYIYGELLDFEITRSDLIIAFGGGVIGDLGGFVASTLFRGIPFVQVPTSLLAQIDSSVGGKVAVNLPQGKNLVGSFYHPEAVFIDTDILKTLDKRNFSGGLAEVIKYGCIRDNELFDKLMMYKSEEELFANIEDIIYTCCDIKREIVEKDEKDKGERMLLNFGHTIGHAVEKYFGFEKFIHGEAVAIGMYGITLKSEEMQITKNGTSELIKNILIKYNLPYKMPNMDKGKVIEAINLDKKSKGDNLNIVLIKEIGESFIKKIDRKAIDEYL